MCIQNNSFQYSAFFPHSTILYTQFNVYLRYSLFV